MDNQNFDHSVTYQGFIHLLGQLMQVDFLPTSWGTLMGH